MVKNLVGLVRIALARGPVSDEGGEPRSSAAASVADSDDDEDEEEDDEGEGAGVGAHGEREGGAEGASGSRAWVPREAEWVFKRMGRAAANGTDAQVRRAAATAAAARTLSLACSIDRPWQTPPPAAGRLVFGRLMPSPPPTSPQALMGWEWDGVCRAAHDGATVVRRRHRRTGRRRGVARAAPSATARATRQHRDR